MAWAPSRMTSAMGMFVPPPVTPTPGSPRRNKHGYLTQAATDTAAHLRERARNRASHPDNETEQEPDPDDRFPEEPPF